MDLDGFCFLRLVFLFVVVVLVGKQALPVTGLLEVVEVMSCMGGVPVYAAVTAAAFFCVLLEASH